MMYTEQRVIEYDAPDIAEFINFRDVLRYSGCGKNVETRLEKLASQSITEILSVARPRAVVTRLGVHFEGDEADLGFYKCKSSSLRQFLGGDCEAYVFAATLGIGVDRLIMRYSPILQSRAVMLSSAGSAVIEAFCDKLCRDELDCPEQKRFSPGYGDLPLELQREILECLDASRLIGLTLTESMMLSPSKSVTAITQIKG